MQSRTSSSVSERWICTGTRAFGGELGDEAQRRLVDGVDRVRAEARGHERAELGEPVEALGRGLGTRLVGRALEAEEHLAHGGAHAAVDERARDVELEPVHVPAPRRAGADHLEAREPRAPVDVLARELGLGRPDAGLEPLA